MLTSGDPFNTFYLHDIINISKTLIVVYQTVPKPLRPTAKAQASFLPLTL